MTAATTRSAPPAPKASLFELTKLLPWLWSDPIAAMEKLHAARGDLIDVSAGPWRHYVLRQPRLIHTAFLHTESYEKPRLASWFKDWFGEAGLVRPEAFRKAAIRSFYPARISALAQGMSAAIEPFVERWTRHAASRTPIDLASEMMQLSFTAAARALFSADLSAEAAKIDAHLETIQLHYAAQPMRVVLNVPSLLPTPAARSFRRAVEAIHQLCERLVRERRAALDRGEDAPDDLLTALINGRDDAGQPLAGELMRNVVMAGLLSSYETTGCALAWSCHLLAQHPSALDRGAGTDDAARSWLDRVFSESLRLYPPSWVIVRQIKQPVELDGFQLKTGAKLLVSPYLVHRHPDFWPAPERFDPERFSSERKLEPGSYIPFGAGPHRCFGDYYAARLAQLTLSALAQRFTITPVLGKNVRPRPLISLRPEPGVWVVLAPRKER